MPLQGKVFHLKRLCLKTGQQGWYRGAGSFVPCRRMKGFFYNAINKYFQRETYEEVKV